MPIYRLTRKLAFPNPSSAEDDGLLAVGGDLSVERLVLAYSLGIFPWYSEDQPILWWSPDPRLVLFPEELRVSKTLRQTLRKGVYRVTYNQAFDAVIRGCANAKRKGDAGTWITDEMIDAYIRLHQSGWAHSVEAWDGDELAGGLYGVMIGRAFFGESMFAIKTDASKVAFVECVGNLAKKGIELIDCQVSTEHLKSFGAKEIPRDEFAKRLHQALKTL